MSTADEVLKAMCQSYSSAVNASDSVTYAKLFTHDAIRMPQGHIPSTVRSRFNRVNRPTTTWQNGT
jgi:ketosteroid isomerase-like protein